MGLASLAGVPFRIDPNSITWTYAIKAASVDTVGGKVVQIYGATLGDMVVQGAFGAGGWEEQDIFFQRIKALVDQQLEAALHPNSNVEPLRFFYPPHGWDFLVYLKQYGRVPGGKSVLLDNEEFSPKWALTLFMVEDNAGLKKIAQDQFIERLAAGLGWQDTKTAWQPSEFNGPIDNADAANVQAGMSMEDYLTAQFNLGQGASNG